jgi:hypothetical protein
VTPALPSHRQILYGPLLTDSPYLGYGSAEARTSYSFALHSASFCNVACLVRVYGSSEPLPPPTAPWPASLILPSSASTLLKPLTSFLKKRSPSSASRAIL